ncbi:hypothetical protein H632_c295p1 [Helicosporidium sp. ATCC 50920]|nr:hypothetical protein H632_c295p1 [Helicosporidium sp. ATCC 50920]|eukprot:KDD76258.1 hypothetical protein H632_c295p1 [Helicosporidium sp. ATCC 50920]
MTPLDEVASLYVAEAATDAQPRAQDEEEDDAWGEEQWTNAPPPLAVEESVGAGEGSVPSSLNGSAPFGDDAGFSGWAEAPAEASKGPVSDSGEPAPAAPPVEESGLWLAASSPEEATAWARDALAPLSAALDQRLGLVLGEEEPEHDSLASLAEANATFGTDLAIERGMEAWQERAFARRLRQAVADAPSGERDE